jgi:hypothetical protein
MSGALPKRELLWHMRRVAASPPYAGKLNPQWAAQNGLAGEDDCVFMLRDLMYRRDSLHSSSPCFSLYVGLIL